MAGASHRAPIYLAVAAIGGLCAGFLVPESVMLRPLALPCTFVQTLVAVGALAGTGSTTPVRWYLRAARRHVLISSVPLMVLGMTIGLDHWLGIGTFLLGAVPPANAIPSYIAVCGGDVRSAVRFTFLGYGIGVIATPALVLVFLGTRHSIADMVIVLLVGLVLPAVLGSVIRPWMQRVTRTVAVAILSVATLVVMIGMGADLGTAATAPSVDAILFGCAALIALGRCVWGGVLGWWTERDVERRLDSAITAACKNCVLAALIATSAAGPAAALPALLGLFAESAVLLSASRLSRGY